MDLQEQKFRHWFGYFLGGLALFFIFAYFFDVSYSDRFQDRRAVAGTTTDKQLTTTSSGGTSTGTSSTGTTSDINTSNSGQYLYSGSVSNTGSSTGDTQTSSQDDGPAVQVNATDKNGVTTSSVGTADSEGNVSVPLNTSQLSDGPIVIETRDISHVKPGSNVSGATPLGSRTVIKNTSLPQLRFDGIISPTKSKEITITGTKSPHTAVFFNGKEVVKQNQEAVWRYRVSLNAGVNKFELWARDGVGNTSERVTTAVVQADNAKEGEPVPSEPSVVSNTHPDENHWYASRSIGFTWSKPDDVNGFSYVFDQSATTEPPNSVTTTDTNRGFSLNKDGVWYFHIKAQNLAGWGKTSHYKVSIDATAPQEFEIGADSQPSAPVWQTFTLYFQAKDSQSGIEKYAVKVDDADFVPATESYAVSLQKVGAHKITVKAFDKAGNVKESSRQIQVLERTTPVKEPVVALATIDAKPVAASGKPVIVQQPNVPVTLKGQGPANVSLLIFVYSKPVVAVVRTDSEGKWTYVLEQQLPLGEHTIYTTAVDAEGVVSPRVKLTDFSVQAASGGSTTDQVNLIRSGLPTFWSNYSVPLLLIGGLLIVGVLWFALRAVIARGKNGPY